MKKKIRSVMCATLASISTVAILAQTPSSSGTQTNPSQQQAAPSSPQAPPASTPPAPTAQAGPESSDRRVTVTGCLEAAPSVATATAGKTTPGATDTKADPSTSEAKFLLTNATTATSSDNAPAPSTPPSTPPSTAKTYRLIANNAALSPHVGKKLELTGTVEDRVNTPGASSDSSSSASAANAPQLRAESGKVLAPSCSEK
jgi:hypothetical protein